MASQKKAKKRSMNEYKMNGWIELLIQIMY